MRSFNFKIIKKYFKKYILKIWAKLIILHDLSFITHFLLNFLLYMIYRYPNIIFKKDIDFKKKKKYEKYIFIRCVCTIINNCF